MHFLRIVVWYVLIGWGLLGAINAQEGFNYGYLIGPTQGLPSDRVNMIEEDETGFLWLATNDGLVRYDGAQFKSFKRNHGDPHSLIDNRTRCLLIDGDYLWIGTINGLSRFNLKTEQFQNYQFDLQGALDTTDQSIRQMIWVLYKDRSGTIWVGTENFGFARYFADQDSFQCYGPKPEQFPASISLRDRAFYILNFCQDVVHDSIMWVGTHEGLIEFNTTDETLQFYHFERSNKVYQLDLNAFRRLYQHDDRKLYVGTWHGGFNIFDPETKDIAPVPHDYPKTDQFFRQPIRNIRRVTDSTLWLTYTTGLVTYNLNQQNFTHFLESDVDDFRWYAADFVDAKGRIYVFTTQGMIIYDPLRQQFSSASFKEVNDIAAGYAFSVVMDTFRNRYTICGRNTDGLYHYDLATNTWSKTNAPSQFLFNNRFEANDLTQVSKDKYILATTYHVLEYYPETETIQPIPITLPAKTNKFLNTFKDSEGQIWIASWQEGVFRWNLETNRWKQFLFKSETRGLKSSTTDVFKEDKAGNVWIKRPVGYGIFLPKQDTMLTLVDEGLPAIYHASMAEDGQGRMWLASQEGWIGYVLTAHPGQGIVEKIEIGEYDEVIQGIGTGPEGNLWVALKNDLYKIDVNTLEKTVFSYKYGASPSDFSSMQFLPDGKLVFGMQGHMVIADPATLRTNSLLPTPYITTITVNENPLPGDTVTYLRKGINLRPDENFFSISFSAIGHTLGNENQFRYRLKGFRDAWINAGDRRFVNFTNVPGGAYTFELQAANNEGTWNEEKLSFPILIGTVWYKRTWVHVLAVFLMLALAYGGFRFRVAEFLKEERMRSEYEQKLASVQMSALSAQMNPHFIFNCLSSIESYVIKNDKVKAASYLNDFARLIRLILQNSRAKYVTLDDEIEALELYLEMESLRFMDKLSYQIKVSEEVDPDDVKIPPMLIQPYVENAILHGLMHKPGGGKLIVSIEQEGNALVCVVSDNGVGRKKSQEINQRRRAMHRKSMGMDITGDRIEILNRLYDMEMESNIIDLEDEAGNALGTKVVLRIAVW